MLILLLLVNAFIAWRYAEAEIDPDWAIFNMAAFTGSWYGRDFADCKPPTIHLWYWAIAKVVGVNVKRVRFAHHFLIGAAGGLLAVALTGDFWAGLAFAVLVNSGWWYAFHGNVSQPPALFLLLAIGVDNPWIAAFAMGVAVAFEPKLMLAFAAMVLLKGWYLPVLAYGILAIGVWFALPKQWREWIWESTITIPKRMGEVRVKHRLYPWQPWYTANAYLYSLPWILAAVVANPDWKYWLAPALYMLMVGYSKAHRQNHMLPLAAWIALSGMNWWIVLALFAWDWLSAGFYLGDIWGRFYVSLQQANISARRVGEWLRDKPGSLWLNDFHTAVHIYSRKPVEYHMLEQLEINYVETERREAMKKEIEANPPDWIVMGRNPGVSFKSDAYMKVAVDAAREVSVWQKA